jgi:NADPH-dependent glutamate synthase beta subunit-like oxidoreductase
MAAYELSCRGHFVEVFDSASEPGGKLRWAIPSFRLPKEEISRSIEMLVKMGIRFRTGVALGKELELDRLEREWDAIFLATGAWTPLHLGIPGEEFEGVHEGLDLLKRVQEGTKPELGRSTLVIGGGNTAVDAALTCRKLGVKDVTIVCLEEKGNMPAFRAELEEALEERISVQNCWGPQKISRKKDGRLTVDLSRCLQVFDDHGNFNPLLEPTCTLAPSADSVVVAIGQRSNLLSDAEQLKVEGEPGNIADPVTLQTKRPKIFIGGDAGQGKQSVVDALAQGREAAISIDRMLGRETLKWGRMYWEGTCITDFPIDRSQAILRPQIRIPRIPVESRELYTESEKTLDEKEARAEAERCLNCGRPGEVNQTCWYCLPCEIECPVDALEVRLPYLVR